MTARSPGFCVHAHARRKVSVYAGRVSWRPRHRRRLCEPRHSAHSSRLLHRPAASRGRGARRSCSSRRGPPRTPALSAPPPRHSPGHRTHTQTGESSQVRPTRWLAHSGLETRFRSAQRAPANGRAENRRTQRSSYPSPAGRNAGRGEMVTFVQSPRGGSRGARRQRCASPANRSRRGLSPRIDTS